jgi:hypothetical protein
VPQRLHPLSKVWNEAGEEERQSLCFAISPSAAPFWHLQCLCGPLVPGPRCKVILLTRFLETGTVSFQLERHRRMQACVAAPPVCCQLHRLPLLLCLIGRFAFYVSRCAFMSKPVCCFMGADRAGARQGSSSSCFCISAGVVPWSRCEGWGMRWGSNVCLLVLYFVCSVLFDLGMCVCVCVCCVRGRRVEAGMGLGRAGALMPGC